jgi:hypothetical protein
VANQIEVHLSNGKVVWYDGEAADVGGARRRENGLVLLKEWGSRHTFYLNPDQVVLLIDHGAPENAGQHAGRTSTRRSS